MSHILGFPIVHLDKEREQLIGDIIKIINPIKAINPEYKKSTYLQGFSRKTLEKVKELCGMLLAASLQKFKFTNIIHEINLVLSAEKSNTKKSNSWFGGRTRRKK